MSLRSRVHRKLAKVAAGSLRVSSNKWRWRPDIVNSNRACASWRSVPQLLWTLEVEAPNASRIIKVDTVCGADPQQPIAVPWQHSGKSCPHREKYAAGSAVSTSEKSRKSSAGSIELV
jgi:hypothetical protein